MVGGPVSARRGRRVMEADAVNGGRAEQAKMFNSEVPGDSTKKRSAKALLHELCATQHWKKPLYSCCYDEGPPHQKRFTFKVVLEIEGAKTTTLECFGYPQTTKKAATDAAAEGALWCLTHMV